MKKQLLLCKRLFTEGSSFAERRDPVSCGMAISFFQDSVEMLVWTLVKERSISVKEGASFTSNLETIQKAGISLSNIPKLHELNKARVVFKHYGNLPAPEEAIKYQAYVEDFLRLSLLDHFGQSYDDLSLVDLVTFPDVKERLKLAEEFIANGEYAKAMPEAGIAKVLLFRRLERFVPNVDRHLGDIDNVLHNIPELRSIKAFGYLTSYLELLRETTLASLLRIPLQDYSFVRMQLPSAVQFRNGKWQTTSMGGVKYDEPHCRRAISCLVDLCIRMESVL
ncbi:MAG: hypothetical protein AB9919_12305 [Geobacteraceae bacterium]